MKIKYVASEYNKSAFHYPHCNVCAQQHYISFNHYLKSFIEPIMYSIIPKKNIRIYCLNIILVFVSTAIKKYYVEERIMQEQ